MGTEAQKTILFIDLYSRHHNRSISEKHAASSG